MNFTLDWHFSNRHADTILAISEATDYSYTIREDEENECFRVSVFKEGALEPWYEGSFETLCEAVRDCENTEFLCKIGRMKGEL